MLPARERLSRTDFTSFLNESGISTVYNRLGTLKYKVSSVLQVSVVTSSKHEKRAVARNTLRRRLYALFPKKTFICKGILYVSKQSYTFSYADLKTLHADLVAKATKAAQNVTK